MSVEKELYERSESKCELCTSTDNLKIYGVPPSANGNASQSILICKTCLNQLENTDKLDVNHWRCLNDSMWNQVPAVQVVVWRMLNQLRSEGWPADLLDMLYLDEETLKWAQSIQDEPTETLILKHIDSYGSVLEAGDTVVLVKDLNVKGTGFTAKRGTAVRGISLVSDNFDHIEGKVNGQQIVILTKFVKKTN